MGQRRVVAYDPSVADYRDTSHKNGEGKTQPASVE
jgi:hypothetical protein